MLTTIRRAEYFELIVLFFINLMAMGMWLVPLSAVLEAHGLQSIRPYAFATSGIAAFVSPLVFGAMADRHAAPVVVLRGLALATAASMALATTAIKLGWKPGVVLALIQLHALFNAPTFGISTTIVFSRLKSSEREFGPIRAMGTLGWMTSCWIVSLLGADSSTWAGYSGVIAWLGVAAYTFVLPAVPPPENPERLTIWQRMGWDALTLLRNRDHRVVFITVALFNATLASLYPFSPPHLKDLGFQHTSAWMSLAQITEITTMFALGILLTRLRLKWIFLLGLLISVIRFGLCALNTRLSLLSGLIFHGASYTLVFVTSQIYLEQRVDRQWRARAQSMQVLMTSGFGSLFGYLGTGWWFNASSSADHKANWPLFWSGMMIAGGAVMAYFLITYRGRVGSPAKETA